MVLPLNQVITGDCVEVMRIWPEDSIDLVVTSPPYWGLRDYGEETVRVWGGLTECKHEWREQTSSFNKQGGEGKQSTNVGTLRGEDQKSDFCSKCGAWRGSLGLEPHPQLFIDHLVEICREIKRVLKPSGTFWLNLGDTYFTGAGKSRNPGGDSKIGMDRVQPASSPNRTAVQDGAWLQSKQKLMIPARVAIALQDDGWILRSDIIWHKPNAMPSSVKDRLTCVHEHFFLFVKQRLYYFDLDAIRKPHQGRTSGNKKRTYFADPREAGREHFGRTFPWDPTVKGKNPGDIWEVETSKNAKFLDKTLSSPKRHLARSRDRYRSLGLPEGNIKGKNPGDLWRIPTKPFPGAHFATFPPKLIEPIIKAGSPKGGVVLDPFGGSGTVGKVARRLGRRFILIEVVPEYSDMARQRVRGKYKPIPEGVTQLDQIPEAET